MTIFIFSQERAFCGPKSLFGHYKAVFCAFALVCTTIPAAHAGRFNSPKDREQGDTLYQQAFSAYQAGDYTQARSLIEKADVLKPDQPDGWNLRGMVYLKQNAFDKAEGAFSRAVALDPKLWAAQFNLAEVPFQGKDYARARGRFEKLLGQTDRFKEARQWELVQYKTFLCCLLVGDLGEASRKLGRLPATGGVTPAYFYSQAALAYSRKDPALAQKAVASAQTTFSPLLNDLFSNSLVEIGWEVPTPVISAMSGALTASSSSGSSGPTQPRLPENHTPIVIDPKLEAAAAEPLPLPDAPVRPVATKVNGSGPRPAMRINVAPPLPPPSSTPAPATPTPEVAVEHRGLLLE